MLKTFLQHIAVVLCKKRLEKTANIRKTRAFWKLQNGHFGSKINNAKKKNAKNVSTTHYSCSMEKTAPKKTANIRKMRPFWNLPKLGNKKRL